MGTADRVPAPLLARVPLFAGLPPQALDALAQVAGRRTYRARTVIFHEGDSGTALYAIEDGRVKIAFNSPDGREAVPAILTAGDVFGELALLDGAPRSATATALVTTRLVAIHRDAFLPLVQADGRMAVALLAVVAGRLRRSDQLVQEAAFCDVRERLVRRLVELAQGATPAGPARAAIPVGITQTDLAQMIGASRESVNKWLAHYALRGLVRMNGRRLEITDLARLRQEMT